MTRRLSALLLAMTMVFQLVAPQASIAKQGTKKTNGSGAKIAQQDKKKYRKIGVINGNSYDGKVMNALNREAAKNRKMKKAAPGISLFSAGPYFGDNNEPTDANKPKYYGNINVDFKLSGLDGNPFQWNEIFGVDEKGNPKSAQIIFVQTDDETGNETGVQYILKVTQTGKYTWSDVNGNPTKLPLFSKALKPYNYEARVDEDVAENIKLLTARMTGTEGANPTFSPENADGEIIANITLDLGLQQVASTKFKSEWKTGVEETKRPQIQGSIAEKVADLYDQPVVFDLPKNNKDAKIIRDWEDAFEDGLMVADALYKTPTVKLVETNANGLTFDTTNKTVKSGDHKYKYDFSYDVINGGKLTMTEVIPVTFDANGGKFDSVTEPNAEQKIKKEVDYDGTLTDKAEVPKKDRETFKGWGTKDAQGKINPVTDADFAKIQSAKTFYAIWDNNAITADELTVHESYNDGTKYVNDFIPSLDTLKGKVKIKDANGNPQALDAGDTFAIVDGSNEYTADGDGLKNYLYGKLQEKKNPNDEPTRKETVKAKVTHKNGTSQTVDISIKVIKNIYEAYTEEGKPNYVPKEYVKVTVDPTTKAKEPQKYFYYVNPKASVVIPGKDPVGTGDNKFVKWTIPGTPDPVEYKLTDKPRHQFTTETTITAQYVSDVIPANADGSKPDTVPKNYVEVKFVPTDKATDETKAEKIFWVNPEKEVTIPVTNPVGKQYFTFKEWKMGADAKGDKYTPTTPKQFKDAATITATYDEAKNIIPFDPTNFNDPKIVRPDGYVKVTFAAEKGLKLKEQKAYYVKANAGITLGNAELVKPGYEAQTGYEFKAWDKADTTPIGANDIVVTAKATALPDYDTKEHLGYVKVTFKAGENGVIKENGNKVDEKVYYVNPNKYVNLPAPTPDGNTGYDFSAWKSDKSQSDFSLANFVNYKEDTTITAMFNQKDAVYPKLKGTTKPTGYVEVTFAITGQGGKIADSEVKTYYVDPTRQVSLKVPKTMAGTGFIFDKWRLGENSTDPIINPAEKKQYTNNTTIYGSFVKLKDIIPATNSDGTPNLQPVDYVAVLFIGGDHANKLDGQILYYVNPKANPAKTIGILTKPTVTPDTGWKHTGWDQADTTEIKDYIFVVAQYDPIADVVPALKDDGTPNDKPAGYVEVKFVARKNGKIQEKGSDITEKVYYVNPNKYVKLNAPNTVPDTGYVFGSWKSDKKVFSLDNFIRYEHDTTITANFNLENKVIPKINDGVKKPDDFVTVNFVIDPATGGQIEANQTITYFVKKGEAVTIHPPKTKADTGYEFDKWDKDATTPTAYNDDVTTVKGSFKKLNDIIKSKEADGTVNAKPEGYVTVQFLKGDNGVLDGQTTFYVNPKAGKKLEDLDTKGITVVPNPTYKFDKWDKAMDTPIKGSDNIDVKATYSQLPNIIKAGPKDTAPAGYVVIIFETDGRGTITGNKAYEDKTNPKANENEIVYFVNPKKGIKLAKADAKASETVLPVPSTAPYDATKYEFDQWRTTIDTDTSITRGRVHIAMFKPKQVTLTYVANGATGTVPPELTVDYDANVRLAGKGDLTKKDASFKGWKIGDTIYQAGDQINLKDNKTAYAQWDDDKKIIEYDPVKDPTTRPDDTYVRVTFAADPGLKLTQQKAYYVKQNAKDEHGTALTLASLTKPTYEAQTGYKFDKWDKEDSLVIGTGDIVVTAKAASIPDFVEKTNEHPNKPDDKYVTVTFKADNSGNGTVTEKTYFVNPNKYVTLTPPDDAKGKTGYEFGSWSQDAKIPTVYAKDTTITASFNETKAVIPNKNPDGTENKKPAGYKTVTFVIDPTTGGKIADNEITVYYVNPAKEVTVPQPKTIAETGYEFGKWDQDTATAKKYAEDTTVKGNFKKLDDIIPSTDANGKPNAKPDGYITVTFDKGDHGKEITGQTVYYVNPKADSAKTLGDTSIVKPTVKAETGYKFTGWDTKDDFEIKADKTVKAQYEELKDVIPKTKNDESEKPKDYITVTFSTETNGKIKGTTDTTKVVYVNPNKAVVLKGHAPEVTPNTGFDFASWDTQIDKKIQYSNGDTIKAQYNVKGDVIPQKNTDGTDKPAGYLTVTFDKGDHGTLSGKTVYYVKPNKEVTVPAPDVTPSVGYEFEKWDKELTQTFAEDTKITAQYKERDNIIPQGKPDGSDRPDGYFTVTFKSDANGSLSGKTVYYVKPNTDIDLTNTAKNITKNPNVGYTADGGTWTPAIASKKYTENAEYTFKFKALDDVIQKTKNDESEKPKDYVTVKFLAGTNGTLEGGDKTYYVNPLKGVKLGSAAIPVPATTPKTDYEFKEWIEAVDTTKTITRDQTHVAQFNYNPATVTLTYEAPDKTSGDVPVVQTVKKGNEVTLAGPNTLKKDNATFKGWKIGDQEYDAGATITLNDNTTATAVWSTNSHTVSFDTDGGSFIPPQTVEHGSKITPVTTPTKAGFTFTGWTTTDGQPFDPEKDLVNGKITLVAKYVPDVIPQDGPTKPDTVPEGFVEVKFVPTDKATDETKADKIFWVNPEKEVSLHVTNPVGKTVNKEDGTSDYTWTFTGWDKSTRGKFTEETTITAQYKKSSGFTPIEPIPEAQGDFIYTPHGKAITKDQYEKAVKLPKGYSFATGTTLTIDQTTAPDVNKSGRYSVKGWVTYPDGKEQMVTITVVVGDPYPTPQPDPIPQPYPTPQPNFVPYPVPGETKTVYKDRTVLRREVRYMQGFEGKFRPNDGLTRAEAAQILANALKEDGYPFDLNYKLPYKDTTKEMWYNDAVRITTQADVFIGYDDGEFKPQRKITRAEWIATLRRFQYVDKVGGNSLHMRKNHWAIPEVEAAYRSGWLSIYTEKKAPFNYDEPISRKEVAAVSNRAFRRVRDMAYIRRNDKFMINYTDINRDMWAYDDILCASNTFLHQRQGAYIAYKRGDKAYTIDVKDAIIEQDLFQRIPRHR